VSGAIRRSHEVKKRTRDVIAYGGEYLKMVACAAKGMLYSLDNGRLMGVPGYFGYFTLDHPTEYFTGIRIIKIIEAVTELIKVQSQFFFLFK
jgi:hypothetical protein